MIVICTVITNLKSFALVLNPHSGTQWITFKEIHNSYPAPPEKESQEKMQGEDNCTTDGAHSQTAPRDIQQAKLPTTLQSEEESCSFSSFGIWFKYL